MPSVAEMRAGAADHARQLDSVRWLGVKDLVLRWGIAKATVRAIPRDRLPYLLFGESNVRRYDPRDVEAYEDAEKRGPREKAS